MPEAEDGGGILDEDINEIAEVIPKIESKPVTEDSSKSGSVGSSTGDKITFPNIYFGSEEARLVDWRKVLPEEVDPDDEDLGPVSEDFIRMTGIDPDELFGPDDLGEK
jgi:hypothetical protein